MLEELLKKCHGEENGADKSAENVKTAVLSRIEEERHMKHFSIKPLIIAAAITAAGALSLVTANAATDGAVAEGIAKTFSFIWNGQEVEGTVTEYEVGDDSEAFVVGLDIPDEAAESGMTIIVESDDGGMKILDENNSVIYSDGE
ncbi:MAG: hypothetical protein NC299_12200 [Lachnospiraceae bacterium]|nr:hypothetical protein [Ruminococcus sp.]MCM1276103.1 hypothetical protein [Lachnospiraceae bacterium]